MPPRIVSRNFTQCPLQRPHSSSTSRSFSSTPVQRADLIKRPHRPYTFTQLLTLSDGSTVLHRTTSPLPVYRSSKDIRNTPLWNPSNAKMANMEEDEAGRLRAFRRRFGRSWDSGTAKQSVDDDNNAAPLESIGKGEGEVKELAAMTKGHAGTASTEASKDGQMAKSTSKPAQAPPAPADAREEEDNLMDLISNYNPEVDEEYTKSSTKANLKRKGKK